MHAYGNNRFDEKAAVHFKDTNLEFRVKSIDINKFGDLEIALSNDFYLYIFADVGENGECWRFFEAGNSEETHIIMTGSGFYEV